MPAIQFTFEVNDQVSGALEGIKATFENAFEKDKTLAKFNAGLGQSTKVTEQMGKLASKVWTDGWGGSLGDVTDAIGAVGSQMVDLGKTSPAEIEKLTRGALDLAEVMGADVTEVTRAAGQMMKNGLAPDAQTAFDIIATGAQNGANRSGDLLDTLTEYSPSFAALGIDGPTALGMLNQALDAGVVSTDKAADAINEFGIRAIDGSKGTSEAYAALGLNADEMAQKIAAGGPTAQTAFSTILTALGGMTDPVARETTGVALFGSMWEDSGNKAILSMDPAALSTENLAGKTEEMGGKLHDTAENKVDRLKRSFEDWKTSMVNLDGPMQDVATWTFAFGPDAIATAGSIGMIATALKGIGLGALVFLGWIAAVLGAIAAVYDMIQRVIGAFQAMKDVMSGKIASIGKLPMYAGGNLADFYGGAKGVSGSSIQASLDKLQSAYEKIPGHALGGITQGPHLAWVGEGGEDELILPLSKAPAVLGEAMGRSGGGPVVNVHMDNGFVGSRDQLANAIRDVLAYSERTGRIPRLGFG